MDDKVTTLKMKNVMMDFVKTLTGVAAAALVMTGCQKSGEERTPEQATVSPQVMAAFADRFPGAENVRWSMKGGYAVANFYWVDSRAADHTPNHSAWFGNADGQWTMTETEILYSALPQSVKSAFEKSEYAAWERDEEVDVLYRSEEVVSTVYVIEVEERASGRELDLYYAPEGELVKVVADAGPDYDYGDFIPSQPAKGIEEYIRTNHPNARVIDVDAEYEGTEVELIDGGVKRELFFDRSDAWQYTKTEIRRSELPEKVKQAWDASEYAESKGYRLDDADHFKTAKQGEFYRLELESRRGDVKVKITPEGEVSLYEPVVDGGAGVSTEVDAFIRKNYPGATIVEKEYNNGYLEVEIRHEGREKEVLFNGAGAWVKTSWEVRRNELPAKVEAAIKGSEYASWEYEGADVVQTPKEMWYEVELEDERSDREVTLRIAEDGTIRR